MTPERAQPNKRPQSNNRTARQWGTAGKGGVGNKPLDRVSKAFNGDSVPDLDGHGA
jgi:hypothetical protein